MKSLMLKIIFIGLLIFGLNGCYTIIWSPDMEFPTTANSSTTIYYGDTYFGPYYYFYDYPWWLDIVPPSTGSRSDNHNTDGIRNLGERGTPTRIPELQPVSGNVPPVSTGNTDNSNNSGSSNTETSVRNSSSGSNSSSGRGSSSGSSVRNNNGGRSSGGRR